MSREKGFVQKATHDCGPEVDSEHERECDRVGRAVVPPARGVIPEERDGEIASQPGNLLWVERRHQRGQRRLLGHAELARFSRPLEIAPRVEHHGLPVVPGNARVVGRDSPRAEVDAHRVRVGRRHNHRRAADAFRPSRIDRLRRRRHVERPASAVALPVVVVVVGPQRVCRAAPGADGRVRARLVDRHAWHLAAA